MNINKWLVGIAVTTVVWIVAEFINLSGNIQMWIVYGLLIPPMYYCVYKYIQQDVIRSQKELNKRLDDLEDKYGK